VPGAGHPPIKNDCATFRSMCLLFCQIFERRRVRNALWKQVNPNHLAHPHIAAGPGHANARTFLDAVFEAGHVQQNALGQAMRLGRWKTSIFSNIILEYGGGDRSSLGKSPFVTQSTLYVDKNATKTQKQTFSMKRVTGSC
jgi:hypothetical protein